MTGLTKDEAFAVAEFIDMNIFDAIRNGTYWDSFCKLQNMVTQNLVTAYKKLCAESGYIGLTAWPAMKKEDLEEYGMMDDITFCSSDCEHTVCYRHPKNIKEPQYPHSYADFKGQGMCPVESKTGWDRYCDMNGVEEERG